MNRPIYVEFVQQGNVVKATAIDADSGIEASIVGPAGASQAMLTEGVEQIKAIAERVKNIHLADKSKVFNTARVEALEVENLIEVAKATIVSAAARTESRGAHTVDDYGDTPEHPNGRNDTEWMKHTLWYSDGNRLEYKPVKLEPLTVESVPPKVRSF